MKKFSHRQKLFMILAVALVAVLLQYAFKQALAGCPDSGNHRGSRYRAFNAD